MTDEFAETDEWPAPEGWMQHQAETGLEPPNQDRIVWRDRGARIAALEAENARLAAAASEAQADVERLRDINRELVDTHNTYLGMYARKEAEVERLREGIRALADEWEQNAYRCTKAGDCPVCVTYQGVVIGLRRALLSPSPAATTGEAHGYWLTSKPSHGWSCDCDDESGHVEQREWVPAPVSSGEAGTGEGDCYCPDDHASWCPNLRPAPVVTPSDEGDASNV